MEINVYDDRFNANEWFILITLTLGFLLVFITPKRFSLKESLFFLLFGMFSGKFFDHTISIKPFDFYDVNDNSSFQIADFASYMLYAPFAYFFVYIYEKLQLKNKPWTVIIYVIAWSIIALAVEYVAEKLGVYHYKNGYQLIYGLPIYMITESILVWLYHQVRVKSTKLPVKSI